MTFFCSKFARKAFFLRVRKVFLLCASESYAIVDGDHRQMKADYTVFTGAAMI